LSAEIKTRSIVNALGVKPNFINKVGIRLIRSKQNATTTDDIDFGLVMRGKIVAKQDQTQLPFSFDEQKIIRSFGAGSNELPRYAVCDVTPKVFSKDQLRSRFAVPTLANEAVSGSGERIQFLNFVFEVYSRSTLFNSWCQALHAKAQDYFALPYNENFTLLELQPERVTEFLKLESLNRGYKVSEKTKQFTIESALFPGVSGFGLSQELVQSLDRGIVFELSEFKNVIGTNSFALSVLFLTDVGNALSAGYVRKNFEEITYAVDFLGLPDTRWKQWQLLFAGPEVDSLFSPIFWKQFAN
jgi:hypothetical protein